MDGMIKTQPRMQLLAGANQPVHPPPQVDAVKHVVLVGQKRIGHAIGEILLRLDPGGVGVCVQGPVESSELIGQLAIEAALREPREADGVKVTAAGTRFRRRCTALLCTVVGCVIVVHWNFAVFV